MAKTPILRELVRLGFLGVDEPAREILAEQRAVGGNGVYDKDPQLFCDLMLERRCRLPAARRRW